MLSRLCRCSRLRLSLAAALLLLPALCLAGKHFVMPTPQAAKTYPAHDEHPNEGVTLALDPYDMADKASIFSVPYSDVGFVPIFVVITNDSDQPISLTEATAQLITVNRSKISEATEDDIYRRITRPPSTGPSANPLPWPKKKGGGVAKDAQEEIQNSQFAARAVEPHSTQCGFMFFDVSGISTPLAGAHFYLNRVLDAKGHELMYFEVPLEKYLSAPSKP
jgi:hypothetical protein